MSFATQQLARLLSMADITAKRSLKKEVNAKVIAGTCLQCGKKQNNRRGLCNACYLQFRRAQAELPKSVRGEMEQRHIQEGQILASGEILEIRKPNPFKKVAS